MTAKDQYRTIQNFGCFFNNPWWLDVTCGEANWNVIQAGETFVPYLRRSFFLGEQKLMPPFSGYISPVSSQGDETDLTDELSRMLARETGIQLRFLRKPIAPAPVVEKVTYLIPHGSDPDGIYDKNTKYEIRKALKNNLQLTPSQEPARLLAILKETFQRQKLPLPMEEKKFSNVIAEVLRKEAGEIWLAECAGEVIGGVFTVFDRKKAFYLFGGTNSKGRSLGANTILLDHVIRRTLAGGRDFDFEGSSVPSIAKYFKGFGGSPVPIYQVTKKLPFPYRVLAKLGDQLS